MYRFGSVRRVGQDKAVCPAKLGWEPRCCSAGLVGCSGAVRNDWNGYLTRDFCMCTVRLGFFGFEHTHQWTTRSSLYSKQNFMNSRLCQQIVSTQNYFWRSFLTIERQCQLNRDLSLHVICTSFARHWCARSISLGSLDGIFWKTLMLINISFVSFQRDYDFLFSSSSPVIRFAMIRGFFLSHILCPHWEQVVVWSLSQ
jgi:hypothetical protein